MGQGGAEKIVYQLAISLREEFDNVVVASTGGQKVEQLSQYAVTHVKIDDIERKQFITLLRNLSILISTIKEYNITHIHSHHRMGLLYCQIIKKIFPNIRFIYTAHNIFSTNNKFYKHVIQNMEIVAVGEGVKRHLIQDVGVPSNQIQIIYNGVQKVEYISDTVEDFSLYTGKKVLCVARLNEQKGIKYLIDAIKKVKNDDYKVFLVGEGELLEELQEQVILNDLSRKIVFLGYQDNVQDYIRQCDFMVLPSLWEGFPLTPIECFMNQKTIIATDIAGTNEIVNGDNGLLLEVKNVESLADAIDFFLSNPELVANKSKNAYQAYKEKFSYDIFLQRYKELYFKE
uniref:Glycosyltransferase n=1 Tax=Streptococcus suis TaxID=1307 RepID=A0A1P8VR49_STRSU|nr:Glycosyltransferase [Streptococcus suis]